MILRTKFQNFSAGYTSGPYNVGGGHGSLHPCQGAEPPGPHRHFSGYGPVLVWNLEAVTVNCDCQ